MAEKIGVSEPTYRRYETDKSSPDILMLDKIAKVLDKNFLELLPIECFQSNTNQLGGIAVSQNLGTINNLSEKLIEQYEIRLKEKDEIIKDLKKIG
jgi:transcriptional regulator with XRE-family HTH domain